MKVKACLFKGKNEQSAEVFFNDFYLGLIKISYKHLKLIEYPLKKEYLSHNNELKFIINDPKSPDELNISRDPRKLGFGFIEMDIYCVDKKE